MSWVRSGTDLGVDAVAGSVGRALPLTCEALSDVSVFNSLVGANRPNGLPPAKNVRLLEQRAPSSNCVNGILEIEWESSSAVDVSTLPRTVFAKLPARELSTRVFCNAFRIWERECYFYRNVADLVPFRTPKSYAVAQRRSRFVLLLEDLSRAESVRLFDNFVMLEGPSLETVKSCLSAFAQLHAKFWHLNAEERETLLPMQIHPFNTPNARSNGAMINRAAMHACRRKTPDIFDERTFRFHRRAINNWDQLVDHWFQEPLTLLHGDSHIGNFFDSPEGMGMLDWQAAHWGKPLRDVQYFLTNSLSASILAENEPTLLAHYVGELETHGIELSIEEAWSQYRSSAFQTLMTAVVSSGLGVMTGMDDVITTILRRAVASVQRLELQDWLEDLLR